MTFIVYALPRSRTAWLSRYLSYQDWRCGHDEARYWRSFDDVKSWFAQPNTGTVETALAPWWRLAARYAPDAKTVVIRRPIPEVVDSLRRSGVPGSVEHMTIAMERLARKLDQIEKRVPDVLTVTFEDLREEDVCARVFEHCLPYSHDPIWFRVLSRQNIQIDMPGLLRYCEAYHPQMLKLASMATQQIRTDLAARRVVDAEGMTIQTESFDAFYRDGEPLFRQHLVQVGESPEAFSEKNIPLLRKLDELGYMQVTTARCNGRLFGYLMTIISPSLEKVDTLTGCNTTFFADPSVPGLGLKLQRAAVAALKGRGVKELLLRAGTRGDGPRMSTLYKRIGAADFGQLFRLDLMEA